MVVLVFGILAIIASIIFEIAAKKIKKSEYAGKNDYMIPRVIGIVCLVIAIALIGSSFCAMVPTGNTGILISFGRVEEVTLNSGFNFKMPWQNVVLMDNREQRADFSTFSFSADIQEVEIAGSVNYNIDQQTAMTLYRTVGVNYVKTLIEPRLFEDIKSVVSQYSAEQLVANRSILSTEVRDLMIADLQQYGVNIISVSISNIDFTDAFTNAVEAKQVATQEYQKAQTQEQQKTMETEQAAARKKIDAEAAAEVAKIQADAEAYTIERKAEAESAANDQIAGSLTTQLINYMRVQTWDGKLPTTVLGNDTSLIMDFTDD